MVPAPVGRARTPDDGCRRYRPVQFTFDTRAAVLDTRIEPDWEPAIQEQWRSNQANVRGRLLREFGDVDGDRKIADFQALGSAPWSVVASHNHLLTQIRSAFAWGAYYPALLGAAGLGERMLNDLIRDLRDDYASHPATQRVRTKESFDNWPRTIDVLAAWEVLSDAAESDYRLLGRLRNAAVHYTPGLDADVREAALEAVLVLQRVVEALFRPLGGPPLFIEGIVGASFLARDSELLPLVRRYYLPNCVLVSPRYEMQFAADGQTFVCFDDANYGSGQELTDSDFAAAARGGGGT